MVEFLLRCGCCWCVHQGYRAQLANVLAGISANSHDGDSDRLFFASGDKGCGLTTFAAVVAHKAKESGVFVGGIALASSVATGSSSSFCALACLCMSRVPLL